MTKSLQKIETELDTMTIAQTEANSALVESGESELKRLNRSIQETSQEPNLDEEMDRCSEYVIEIQTTLSQLRARLR